MRDSRPDVVKRLKFLSIIQQLARSDVESGIVAVGLDALTGAFAIPFRESTQPQNVKIFRKSKNPEALNSNQTRFQGNVVSRDRKRNARLASSPQRQSFSIQNLDSHRFAQGNISQENQIAQHHVDDTTIEIARKALRASLSLKTRGSLEQVPRAVNRPEWDDRFGVSTLEIKRRERGTLDEVFATANSAGFKKSLRHHASQPKVATALNETMGQESIPCNPFSVTNGVGASQPSLSANIFLGGSSSGLAKPPIAPHHSLNSTAAVGSPYTSLPETTLSGIPTEPINVSGNARSETPLGTANRVRRGSAVKSRPKPKAANAGVSVSRPGGQVPIQPSDLALIEAEKRRRSQMTPIAPQQLLSSVDGMHFVSQEPTELGRTPPTGHLQPSSPPRSLADTGGVSLVSVCQSEGAGTPTRVGISSSPTPLGFADSGSGAASEFERGAIESGVLDQAKSFEAARGQESLLIKCVEEEREAVERAFKEAERERLSKEKEHTALLKDLAQQVNKMIDDHTLIMERHEGGRELRIIDGKVDRSASGFLRIVEDELMRCQSDRRREVEDGLKDVMNGQRIGNSEVAGELEISRIERLLAEQEIEERGIGKCKRADETLIPSTDQVFVPRRQRTGAISAATVNRLLSHKMSQIEVIQYNEKLWNTSNISQYAFADRLACLLLEDLLGEIAYGEVDVLLSDYVDGLADHELMIE